MSIDALLSPTPKDTGQFKARSIPWPELFLLKILLNIRCK